MGLLFTTAFVLLSLGVATIVFARMVAEDRETRATLDEFWERFWAGHSPVWVRVVGPPATMVTLGMVSDRAEGGRCDLVSAGFSLRADDGRIVDIGRGEKVTLFVDALVVSGNLARLATGTRLMTRLEETRAEPGGPLRAGASGLVVPADGLLLSDRSIRQTPFSTVHRTPSWGRVGAMWLIGAGLAAATWAIPAFLSLALGYAIVLWACVAVSSILYYALTVAPPTREPSEPMMEPSSSSVFRVDFLDSLQVGANAMPAPKPGIIYVYAPGGALTDRIEHEVLCALYHRSWRSGNEDGSRYVVERFVPEAIGLSSLEQKVWRIDKARDDVLTWLMVPDAGAETEGAYRAVGADEFEQVIAGSRGAME